ncbi:MAG: M10 family metallopeptidase C-terminal domain-containing protein [Pikeienuella sp.]
MCTICQAAPTFSPDCPYEGVSSAAVKEETENAAELSFGDAPLSALVFERFEFNFRGNDDFDTRERISVDDTFNGFLSTNDFDVVRVFLISNTTYEISVDLSLSSVDFPSIGIFNPREEIVAVDDNLFDGETSLVFTTTQSGSHFISITSLETLFPIGIPDNGSYRLTIEEVEIPDVNTIPELDETRDLVANDTTTGSIEVGGTFKGFHAANDTDWIAVELTEGQTVTIDLNGFGDTPVRDTVLTIFNEDNQSVATNDDFGFSLFSEVTLTAAYTGTHYIQVETFNQGGDIGAYQVRVFEGGEAPNGGGQDVLTPDEIAAYLTNGFWDDDPFTGSGPFAFDIEAGGTITVDIDALAADGRFLAEAAMEAWTLATGLQFQIVTSGAMITFDDNEDGAFSDFSELNGNTIVSSIVNVSTAWLQDFGTTLDSYSFQTYVHEIGHAIGLGHAGDYNGFARFGIDNHYANDSWQSTVMSYFSQNDNTTINADEAFILTPMAADILAIETLYGLTGDIRTDDTIYGVGSTAGGYYDDILDLTEAVAFTIVDNGGVDTIDLSSFTTAHTISLEAETFSDVGPVRGAMTIARGTVIENFISGEGDDEITGNDAANMLEGGDGADTLIGGGGDDTLIGGDGADVFEGGAGADHFSGGDGFDFVDYSNSDRRIQADMTTRTTGVGDALGDTFEGIEQVSGTRRNDNLRGDNDANILLGGSASDRIFGRAGDDTLNGESGTDIIYGNSGADVMTGGVGRDRFIYFRESDSRVGEGRRDTITDFTSGTDRIEISRIDADLNVRRKQRWDFVEEDAFTGTAGELRFEFDEALGLTLIQGDQTGNGQADFEIALEGDITLVERDFFLGF